MVAETATRTLTYQQAINEALQIAMREDPTVILLGEDIAGGAMVDHLVNDDAGAGRWASPRVSSRSSAATGFGYPDHRGGVHRGCWPGRPQLDCDQLPS